MKISFNQFCCLFGATAFGLFIFALLPQGIVALNDDFAYLRSVVETLQRGRPWTDDWLEPWSAGLSVVAAGFFRSTGSFYFAIFGLLGIATAASFLGAWRLLAERGLSPWRAAGTAGLLLTMPTLLWKEVQFTGMALYAPCLLWALWAAEKRRWGLFFVCWVLAFSTRQSAIVWGMLPVCFALADWRAGEAAPRRALFWPLAMLAGGAIVFLVLTQLMNKTASQLVITDHVWERGNFPQARKALLVGGTAFAVSVGLGACLQPGFARWKGRGWFERIAIIVAVALGVWLLSLRVRDYVDCEFSTYDSAAGSFYLKALIALGAAGGIFGRFSLRLALLAVALPCLFLLTLRDAVWDYYLTDLGVLGFFAVEPKAGAESERAAGGAAPFRWLVRAGGAFVVAFQFFAILQVKETLDRTHAIFDVSSRALEEGKLAPQKASFLPFGLMAWYFFPYYSQHEGKGDPNIADFGRYLDQDTVLVAQSFSKPLRWLPNHDGRLPPHEEGFAYGKFNYVWFWGTEVLLIESPRDKVRPSKTPYPRNYVLPVFPRDDAGWRRLIAGETELAGQ